MTVHTIDIDSGERDASLYPNPNAYTIDLKTPVFDVTSLEVTTARVPTQPFVIHDNNNKFSVRIDAPAPDAGTHEVTMTGRDYPNGTTLAAKVLNAISAAGITTVDNVEFRSTRNSLKFSNVASSHEFTLLFKSGVDGWDTRDLTRTTPNQVFGMPARDISSSNSIIDLEGRVDFECGPKSYVVKITAGSDVLGQTVYSNTPFYTGSFMSKSTISEQYMTVSSNDDDVTHRFTEGPQRKIETLKIQWFYKENNKLVPIDFRDRDHGMKLKLECSLDRLNPMARFDKTKLERDIPKPIGVLDGGSISLEPLGDIDGWVPLIMIVIVGIALMLYVGRPQR